MEANTVKLKELRAIKLLSFGSMCEGMAKVHGKVSECVGYMPKGSFTFPSRTERHNATNLQRILAERNTKFNPLFPLP
jgi:hypothetical protein